MNTEAAKREIEEILKKGKLQNSELEKLIDILQNASNNRNMQKEWITIAGENQDNFIKDEKFEYAWKPRNADGYSYYASNYGRIKLAKNENDLKNEKFIIIKNGYLVNTNVPCTVSEYTDIYYFISYAFRDYKELKLSETLIKNNYPQDNFNNRMELHHINNNPNDNRLINLIYLPKFIHAKAHKYA